MLGRLACGAVSVVSGDAGTERRATCSAYRAANGSLVETCGSAAVNAAASLVPKAPVNQREPLALGRNTLTWSDNSSNESNFIIERCDNVRAENNSVKKPACAGSWKRIGTVAADVTRYVDTTAIVNQTYIYRVKAMNGSGSSGYSNEAVITTPRPPRP